MCSNYETQISVNHPKWPSINSQNGQIATDISVWHQCQHMRGCEERNEKGINSPVCPGLQRRCFILREPKRGRGHADERGRADGSWDGSVIQSLRN